jgi:hypothetical protein
MNSPAKLIFREWKKPAVTYELHGWNPEKSLAFAFDNKGQPQVLEFVLPDQFNGHDRPAPAFPQHPPTEVTEIRLVPPPCRTDQAEAHALRVRAKANTDAAGAVFLSANWDTRWELVRLSYDSEILILRPEDHEPLAELLNKFQEEKHKEYFVRKHELQILLELVRNRQAICGRARFYAHIVSNGYEAPSPDSAWLWQSSLKQELIKLDMNFGQGGYRTGFLQWTLEDARRHPDIRDPYLRSRWATENGLDLQEMAHQRKQISAWTGSGDFVELHSKPLRDLFGDCSDVRAPSPTMLEMAKASDLEFGASIRFRATFENKVQAWLTDCRQRNAHPSERIEFGAAQGKIVTLETIKGGLDSVEKKTDRVLSGVKRLTARATEPKSASDKKARENDFTTLRLPSGKIIHPPESAREILRALVAVGSKTVSCQAIKREVAKIRGEKQLSDYYSPAKVLKGSTGGRAILDERVVAYERKPRQKQVVYSLRLG